MIDITAKLAQDIIAANAQMTAWLTKMPKFQPVLNALKDFEFGYDPYWDGELNFSFSGGPEKLARVWRAIRTAGFELSSFNERPKAKTTGWTGAFSYKGTAEYSEDRIRICVFFTSSVCQRVQIGTETIERPIYEIRCGDEITQEQVDDFV